MFGNNLIQLIFCLLLLSLEIVSNESVGLYGHSQSFSINFCSFACSKSVDKNVSEELRRCFCKCLRKELFDKNNEFFKFFCFEREWTQSNSNKKTVSEEELTSDQSHNNDDYDQYNYPDYYDMYFDEFSNMKYNKNNNQRMKGKKNIHNLEEMKKKQGKTTTKIYVHYQ